MNLFNANTRVVAQNLRKVVRARVVIKIQIHSSCEIEDFCRISSLQAVCDTPIARITGACIKDIGGRLPLELQCSLYQRQQGDVSQSVRGNYKTRF